MIYKHSLLPGRLFERGKRTETIREQTACESSECWYCEHDGRQVEWQVGLKSCSDRTFDEVCGDLEKGLADS